MIASAVSTLEEGLLFRYDSPSPLSSPASCFEREFADLLGARYAVAVNSCSSALFLALLACGVRPGDEVLVPAFTFVAVPSSVIHVGARPVLVEMTEDLTIDPDDMERKISEHTSALLLSYMRGHVQDLDRILRICRDRHVQVIDDVAHGMGVEWDGVPLGRFGRASAFSFQSHKLLDGGEGGMLVTDDRDVALRALVQSGCYDRNWRLHILDDADRAWLEANATSLPAYGVRMSNLTAAVLRPQLARIGERIDAYRARFGTVVEGLAGGPVRLPARSERVSPVPDSLQFEISSLDGAQALRFVEHCNQQGVALQILGLDTANARCFWNWRFFEVQECPRTRALLSRLADVALPLWLEEPLLARIPEVIRAGMERATAPED